MGTARDASASPEFSPPQHVAAAIRPGCRAAASHRDSVAGVCQTVGGSDVEKQIEAANNKLEPIVENYKTGFTASWLPTRRKPTHWP